MFSNKIIYKEYLKNEKIYNLILGDKNVSEDIKKKYEKYLNDRKKDLQDEIICIKKVILDLRKIYEKTADNYIKIEIEKNIIELNEKLGKKVMKVK